MFAYLIIIIWFAVIIRMIQTFDVFVPNKPFGQKDSYFIKKHLRLNFYVDVWFVHSNHLLKIKEVFGHRITLCHTRQENLLL